MFRSSYFVYPQPLEDVLSKNLNIACAKHCVETPDSKACFSDVTICATKRLDSETVEKLAEMIKSLGGVFHIDYLASATHFIFQVSQCM